VPEFVGRPQQGWNSDAFKSGESNEKQAETWEPSQHLLEDRETMGNLSREVAGRRASWLHTGSNPPNEKQL
jgi:hypothetical protein